jgi:hypothetical protein
MTARKPGKRASRPKTTAVPDRSPTLSLGGEAQLLTKLLRDGGAEPDLVPTDLTDAAAREQWLTARASLAPPVSLWLIDLAAAILATIPPRTVTRKGRPLGRAVAHVAMLKPKFGSVAEAARFVAPNYFALKLAKSKNMAEPERISDPELKAHANEIEDDAQHMAREVYRRPKPDMPE